MQDFAGKVAFITGGASGLGFGLAKVFSEAGCKVVIADVRQDHLDEAMAWFRGKNAAVRPIRLDITDREAYARAADEVEEMFGEPPQLLFNNAGVNTFGPTEKSTYEDWDWLIGVDFWGVVNGMQTFVPRMIAAGKGGYIVNTSSLGGFRGSDGAAIYCAAKAAVNNLSESYAVSLKKYGIGVSVCCPANIKSNIWDATSARPEHLKKTGYLVNEDFDRVAAHHPRRGHGAGDPGRPHQGGHRGRAALHHPLSRGEGGPGGPLQGDRRVRSRRRLRSGGGQAAQRRHARLGRVATPDVQQLGRGRRGIAARAGPRFRAPFAVGAQADIRHARS